MRTIAFEIGIGREVKQGSLMDVHNNGSIWHFSINNYHQGELWKRDDVWVFYGNAQDSLMFEDIQILGAMIEEAIG